MTEEEFNIVQNLSNNIITCLMKSDDNIKKWWTELSDLDQKEIQTDMQDTIYDWLSDNDVFDQIMEDRIWPLQ